MASRDADGPPEPHERPWRPTREQIAAAEGATVPDVMAPGLRLLFVGINPGLYSGAVGHHFARPGNRFWRVLHAARITDRVLSPFEEGRLLEIGVGITNLVERATATADRLSPDELREGAVRLRRKAARLRPGTVAFLGLTSYRTAFARPKAGIGPQPETVGRARSWLLPNPSGLNAHYQLPELAELFAEAWNASA
ncbi:MAG TPA: G/U mismatch-specific DNA glycosylase [Actinomycetota bacterium]